MSQSKQMHDPNRWQVCVTNASDISELISKANQFGPTKDDLVEILDRVQHHHAQFKQEFAASLCDIRRALLNIPLPTVAEDLSSYKTMATKNVEKKETVKRSESNTVKRKSVFTALPDLMDIGTNESDAVEDVKSAMFKNPIQNSVARGKSVKSDMSRQQSTAISSTVTGEKDLSAIKSPWARQILKRRLSTYDAPRADPLPNGARAMAVKKRRVSHAATHPSNIPENVASLAHPAVKLKRDATSPIRCGIKPEGEFFFGFSNDEDEGGSNITAFNDGESKKTVKWADSPIGNISEIAKMVEKALLERKKGNNTQAGAHNDGSDVAPKNEQLIPSDALYF